MQRTATRFPVGAQAVKKNVRQRQIPHFPLAKPANRRSCMSISSSLISFFSSCFTQNDIRIIHEILFRLRFVHFSLPFVHSFRFVSGSTAERKFFILKLCFSHLNFFDSPDRFVVISQKSPRSTMMISIPGYKSAKGSVWTSSGNSANMIFTRVVVSKFFPEASKSKGK